MNEATSAKKIEQQGAEQLHPIDIGVEVKMVTPEQLMEETSVTMARAQEATDDTKAMADAFDMHERLENVPGASEQMIDQAIEQAKALQQQTKDQAQQEFAAFEKQVSGVVGQGESTPAAKAPEAAVETSEVKKPNADDVIKVEVRRVEPKEEPTIEAASDIPQELPDTAVKPQLEHTPPAEQAEKKEALDPGAIVRRAAPLPPMEQGDTTKSERPEAAQKPEQTPRQFLDNLAEALKEKQDTPEKKPERGPGYTPDMSAGMAGMAKAVEAKAEKIQAKHTEQKRSDIEYGEYGKKNLFDRMRGLSILRPFRGLIDRLEAGQTHKKVNELSVKVTTLEAKSQRYVEQSASDRTQLETITEKLTKLGADTTISDSERARVRGQLETEKARLEGDIAMSEGEVSRMNKEREWYSSEMKSYERRRDRAIESVTRRLDEKIAPRQERVDQINEDVSRLQQEIEENSAYLNDCRRKLDALKGKKYRDSSMKALEKEITKVEKSMAKRTKELDRLEAESIPLQGRVNKWRTETEGFENMKSGHRSEDREKPEGIDDETETVNAGEGTVELPLGNERSEEGGDEGILPEPPQEAGGLRRPPSPEPGAIPVKEATEAQKELQQELGEPIIDVSKTDYGPEKKVTSPRSHETPSVAAPKASASPERAQQHPQQAVEHQPQQTAPKPEAVSLKKEEEKEKKKKIEKKNKKNPLAEARKRTKRTPPRRQSRIKPKHPPKNI